MTIPPRAIIFMAPVILATGCGMITDVVGPKQESILEDVAEEFIRDEISGVPKSSTR